MSNLVQGLADFAFDTGYDDLPEPVVHESKRIVLDTIGCGLAGLSTPKGQLSVELARRLGGTAESTIIGVGDRVSCTSAGFANGELANALDYDSVPPLSAFLVPAVLALAESAGATGRDVIAAVAVAHEISLRILSSVTGLKDYVRQGAERGKPVWPSAFSTSPCIFGGAAAAGKILRLDREKTAHALGIAGYECPVPAAWKWFQTSPCSLVKYLSAGWLTQAEITAALLAQLGYTGDTTILDGEHGFQRFYSSAKWEPNIISEKLGEEWRLLGISYKPYPCCRIMQSALDSFNNIIRENNLLPEDIEKVNILLDPISDMPIWRNKELTNHVDAQFSVAYVFAVAAHRIDVADWQGPDTIRNPGILDFMGKVSFAAHPVFGTMALKDHRSSLSVVEVVSRGRVFKEERLYAKGVSSPEEFRMKDEELVGKFRHNAGRILPQNKIDEAVKCLLQLERMEDISGLMKQVVV